MIRRGRPRQIEEAVWKPGKHSPPGCGPGMFPIQTMLEMRASDFTDAQKPRILLMLEQNGSKAMKTQTPNTK